MAFDDSVRAAAKAAQGAVDEAIESYRGEEVTDEDDITGWLAGALKAHVRGKIAGLTWSTSVVRHRRGVAAQEKRIGADMLIHVSMKTKRRNYSKGVLIQAKRIDAGDLMTTAGHDELVDQCNKMLSISPASFVLNYTTTEMRCAPALRIAGSTNRNIHPDLIWTSYRFFLEFFRCPIGDSRITSALVANLPPPTTKQAFVDAAEPTVVEITAEG